MITVSLGLQLCCGLKLLVHDLIYCLVVFVLFQILCCVSFSALRAYFTRWNATDQMVFNVSGLSPDMMELIIDFAYTGSVSVTEDNVQELLRAADQLSVMGIVKICCDFLGEQLCPENCVGIWQFTNISFFPELRAKAYRYIVDHFEQVVPEEEFLKLNVEELADILDRDDLNVQEEDTVYETVIKWIAHAPAEREQHIPTLLSKVRLGLMTEEYLRQNVLSNELVGSNPECRSMAVEATRAIGDIRSSRPVVSGFYHPLARPRLPHSILLAIGGWSGSNATNVTEAYVIEAYDYQADRWLNVTNDLECPRAYHGTAFLNGYVYCIGGCNGVEHFNTVHRFDLSTRTWNEVAPMHGRRCYVSVTVLNGCIYAMGGRDGNIRLNTAERYQPETNQWSLIAPMHDQRSDASCTTLNNQIYICGGFNGNDCLATAEFYRAETNQWTMINHMSSPRSGVGVIAYAGQVFAVGGFDGNDRLHTAEVYNTDTNMWDTVSSMLTPRSNFGIEVINNRLFVAGGFNGFTTTFNAECYDAITNEWSTVCDMGLFRSALSCCVVSGLPNLAEYTVPRNVQALLQMPEEQEEAT